MHVPFPSPPIATLSFFLLTFHVVRGSSEANGPRVTIEFWVVAKGFIFEGWDARSVACPGGNFETVALATG